MRNMKKEEWKREIVNQVKYRFRKKIEDASKEEIQQGICCAFKENMMDDWIGTYKTWTDKDKKMVYYLSMEFLMGKALVNNLIDMAACEEIAELVEELDVGAFYPVEKKETDAVLADVAYGCGIRYRHELLRQKMEKEHQKELSYTWLENGNPFEIEREEYAVEVRFGTKNSEGILAVPYDMPVVSSPNGVVNTLRIWDARPMQGLSFDTADKENDAGAEKNKNNSEGISEILYQNASEEIGKQSGIRQQYFLVSASVQTAVKHYRMYHENILGLSDKVCIQTEDMNSAIIIGELMRILLDEYGLAWEQAWGITIRCCDCTNSPMQRANAKRWPLALLSPLLPRVCQIIEEIYHRQSHWKVSLKSRK